MDDDEQKMYDYTRTKLQDQRSFTYRQKPITRHNADIGNIKTKAPHDGHKTRHIREEMKQYTTNDRYCIMPSHRNNNDVVMGRQRRYDHL